VPSRSTQAERRTTPRRIRYNLGVTAARLMALCGMAACAFRSGQIPDGGASHDVIDDSGVGSDVLPLDATVELVALVQQVTGYAPNTNAPLAATLPGLPAAGHLLVMIGAAEHGGLTSVTGGGVGTWTRATRSLSNTNVEIWFGVTDGSSATVTVTFPAFGLPMWLAVSEWSGMAKANLLDGATSRAGATSPADSGAIVTTNARDLILFAVTDAMPNTFGAPGPGTWLPLAGVSSNVIVQAAWYELATTSGSWMPQVSETAHGWDAAVCALRTAP
jgi:hypothetical protein